MGDSPETGRENLSDPDASGVTASDKTEPYEPTWASLDAHEVPDWFEDAKLGIWIHWGVYSVPAWAPRDEEWRHPYAEWYPKYMYEEGTPTEAYHEVHYGDAEYSEFIPEFTAEAFSPESWVELFEEIGAKYVGITAEHHDGFPLWDSDVTPRNAATEGPERDIVAELGAVVRDRGLKYVPSYHGLLNYYDPRYDGGFGHPDFVEGEGPTPEYVTEMHTKLRELIRTHRPDVLWLDGDWGTEAETFGTKEILAEYYNLAQEWDKEVAVNDRLGNTRWKDDGETHGDFVTPEYESFDGDIKWEACRGIGHSFGFNRHEGDEDYLSPGELVRSFVDIVSRNGNLLLNVGPRADGTIPEVQKRRLRALGSWLDVNGEAIFGSRPWRRESAIVEGATYLPEESRGDVDVRYTWNGALYATLFEWPGRQVTLPIGDAVDDDPDVSLLGVGTVSATVGEDGLTIDLPSEPGRDHTGYAYVVRIDAAEGPEGK